MAEETREAANALDRRAQWLFSTPGFLLLCAVIIAILFYDVLLGLRTFSIRDYSIFSYPLASYHKESFWRGELPLWNPYNNCGIPFLAQWMSLTLYPGSLIYLLLPLPWSLSFFCLVHLAFGAVGMYLLARHLTGNALAGTIAGIIYGFNGFTLNCLMWPAFLATLAWAPWVIRLVLKSWTGDRRSLAWAALAGACQMLTGAPEPILVTWLIVGIFWLTEFFAKTTPAKTLLLRLALVVALISCLAAAQLLPFLDMLRHSDRSSQYAGTTWSMPAWGWANFLVPLFRFYRSPSGVYFQYAQDWTSSYYLGVGAILLAFLAAIHIRTARTWIMAALTLVFLLLALGDHTPVYPTARKLLPQLGFMRFPIKFVLVPIFVVPLLSAYGTKWFAEAPATFRSKRIWAAISALLLAAGIGAILLYSRAHPLPVENPAATSISALSRTVLLICITVALSALCARKARTSTFTGCALVAFLIVDLLTHAPPQNPKVSPNVYEAGLLADILQPFPRLGVARAMMNKPTHDRIYSSMLPDPFTDLAGRRLALFGNLNLVDHVPTVDGFYSMYLADERKVWSKLFLASYPPEVTPLANFLAISHVSHPLNFLEWQKRTNALPWLTIGQQPVFASRSEALAAVTSRDFKPAETVYLPETAHDLVHARSAADARISEVMFKAHEVSAATESTSPALLVLAQTYYHCWRAFLDGQPVPLWQANFNYQAVEVPSGKHQVVFRYQDNAFRLGSVLSTLALLACLALLRPVPPILPLSPMPAAPPGKKL